MNAAWAQEPCEATSNDELQASPGTTVWFWSVAARIRGARSEEHWREISMEHGRIFRGIPVAVSTSRVWVAALDMLRRG